MNKKIKSIKVKIIMFVIPMLLVAFITLSGLGYKFASDSLKSSNLNIMADITRTAASKADEEIQSEIRSLEVIASNPVVSDENISLDKKAEILKAALPTIRQLGISISDKDGNSLDSAGNKKQVKTTQSFMKSIKGENAITNPYIDPASKKKVIAYSVPIKNSSDNIIGVITSVKDCEDFSTLSKETNFLKTGSSLIVDSNGNFIVAKDESLVKENKNITNMTSDKGSADELNNIGKSMIIGTQAGIGRYEYDGKMMYMTYSPIGKTGLVIGVTVEENDLLSAISSLAVVDTVVTMIMILLICAIIIGFTIKMINRLLGAKNYVDSIAKGDFYTQIDKKYIRVNDEIGEICTSVGQAKESVGKMIKSVRDNANVVREGSLSLNEISEQLSTLTEEISAAIGEVAISTNKQSCNFEEIADKLAEFGDKINIVNSNVHSINQDISVINDKSVAGTKNINELNNGIISVDDSFERFAASIDYMQGDMKNVNEIINIMNRISEQINLLAFNAAIEAASAGDAGLGFNVIAQEIRKLSDKSKESAQNIYSIINRLISVVNKLVEESKNMDNEVENQKKIIHEASSSFSEIAILVREITPKVSNIHSAFKGISNSKDFIVETVYELSEEIKNTSSSLVQVTDSSVELALFAEKVNNSSEVLLDKADDLIGKVKQFRIEQEDCSEEVCVEEKRSSTVERKLDNIDNILKESSYKRDLDMALVENIKELVMPSKEELSQGYGIEEEINLDLSLVENFIDLSLSPLEKLDSDLPTKDFGWGCSKVTELKEYIKQKELNEHEDLSKYNIS